MMLVPNPVATQRKDALYAALHAAPYGEVFPYEALTEILGVPVQRVRHVVFTVTRRLEREAARTLENIRGHGYRIAEPHDHVELSSRRHQRSRRQLGHALRILQATPIALLTPEERRRHDAWLTVTRQQVDVLRHVQHQVHAAHATVDALLKTHIREALMRVDQLAEPAVLSEIQKKSPHSVTRMREHVLPPGSPCA